MRYRLHLPLATLLLLGSVPSAVRAQPAAQTAPPKIDPQRFAAEVAEFDKEPLPPEGAIVITGASSIKRWHPTIKEDLAGLTVVPRGFGGSTMEDALHWIDRLAIAYKPRAIVIYEGDNDTGRYNVPPAKIVDQFMQIVKKVHAALPNTRIYVIGVKPSVSRWAVWPAAVETNSLLKAAVAKDKRLTYIDVATTMLKPDGQVMTDIFVEDNLHLNPKGYTIWTAAIRPTLIAGEQKFEKK